MLLFLLPFLFNPFSIIVNWLPGLYLAAWPIIIQTLGRETLVTHALVLILFILTCDITRQMMLKTIGFDLLSFPLGVALLLALTTNRGSLFLSVIRPLFSGLLMIVEPVFLVIEMYLFMDMVKSFNRWISAKANARDEDSQDIASWEPPLSRGAVLARVFIIMITIFSYIGTYIIVQESKFLLGTGQDIPINFNHAIAALVTLQLIAISATIYKEEGVLSESAMVALLASIPIFIASWSYYHLKETTDASSSWTSYLPFASLFNSAPSTLLVGGAGNGAAPSPNLGQGFEMLDELSRQLPVSLGNLQLPAPLANLTLDKLAKYYFGPDFWYILAGRFLCLFWWTLKAENQRYYPLVGTDERWTRQARAAISRDQAEHVLGARIGPVGQAQAAWRSLDLMLPIRRRTLIKVLLVLAYAQMIIQQMDNKQHLQAQIGLLGQSAQAEGEAGCCGGSDFSSPAARNQLDVGADTESSSHHLGAWFHCMWTSAKNCAGGGNANADQAATPTGGNKVATRFARFVAWTRDLLAQTLDYLTGALGQVRKFVGAVNLTQLIAVWLARWRSVIVQRLTQSMLVHLHYIRQVVFAYE